MSHWGDIQFLMDEKWFSLYIRTLCIMNIDLQHNTFISVSINVNYFIVDK